MNFRMLQYFIDITECKSISMAAQKNYITQQSMSKQLKNIEQYYGRPLFKRTTPLQLTEYGQLVYEAAIMMRDIHLKLRRDLDSLDEVSSITIGNVYSEAPPFLSALITIFSSRVNGKCSLNLIQNCLSVPESNPDLIFSTEISVEGYNSIELLNDRIVVAISPQLLQKSYNSSLQEKLSMLKGDSPLDVLNDIPFVALASSSSSMLIADNAISKLMHDKHIKVVTKTNSMEYIYSLCVNGQQAIIVNEHFFRSFSNDNNDILIYPIENLPEIHMYLYYREASFDNAYVKEFIDLTKKFFGK